MPPPQDPGDSDAEPSQELEYYVSEEDSDFLDHWDPREVPLPGDEEPAAETHCMWGEDCRRERGRHCPENCLWIHEQGQKLPRCYGFHEGRAVLEDGHPERILAKKHCALCRHRENCAFETRYRFG